MAADPLEGQAQAVHAVGVELLALELVLGDHERLARGGLGLLERVVEPRLAHDEVRAERQRGRRNARNENEGDGQPATEAPGRDGAAGHSRSPLTRP